MTTINARQLQFTKMHIRKTTPREESTVYIEL
jgi:hypothetical protein